jgi:hypothetical protein
MMGGGASVAPGRLNGAQVAFASGFDSGWACSLGGTATAARGCWPLVMGWCA